MAARKFSRLVREGSNLAMNIATIEPLVVNVSAKTNWFFVLLTLESGATGIGEASLNGWERPMLAYLDDLRAHLIGVGAEDAYPLLRTFPTSPGGLVANAVRSAIAQALLDAQARTQEVPVHALLGTNHRARVRMYANINRATVDRSPESCARSAMQAVSQGFTAVKIAPFDDVRRESLHELRTQRALDVGIERVFAIRDAVGRSVDVMVDCHWRFDEATALRVLDRLAGARLFWFECPVPEGPLWHGALARIRAVARERGVLLAGAETQTGMEGFRPFIEGQLFDVIMPDVKYAGGTRATLDIANFAHRGGVLTSPHNPTGPVCTYASLHVAACAPELPLLELQVGESDLTSDLVHGASPAMHDGAFATPQTPGLGIDIDAAVAAAHPYRPVPYGVEEQLG